MSKLILVGISLISAFSLVGSILAAMYSLILGDVTLAISMSFFALFWFFMTVVTGRLNNAL